MKDKYEATIGLEIHAELKTESKMFCGCKNNPFFSKPNENVCPVCLAMPGALPVLNKKAIEWTILTGLALNCKVNEFSKWDRKNYFYPDIPKGYQISQYDLPLVYDGHLEINSKSKIRNPKQISNPNVQNSKRKIRITRIHLEEDTATSKHPEGRTEINYSLIDFNRAGVPLMELVTEPDITDAQEAKEFCQKYQLILRTLGVSDADMEKGQMRCEANISVRNIGNSKSEIRNSKQSQNSNFQNIKLGTKVEVKNLNSFKSVEKAIEYEIERQIEALESGEKIIQQTRGWDEKNQKTYVMRQKETSADYRYFPEPDLSPIIIGENPKSEIRNSRQYQNSTLQLASEIKNIINICEIKKQLPELPDEKMARYIKDYKINPEDAEIIVSDIKKAEYLESCIKYHVSSIKQLVNYIINEIPNCDVRPEYLVELVNLIDKGKISGKIAKEILPEIRKGKSPKEIVKNRGLEQISDTSELEKIVDKIIKKNSDAVAKIKLGQMGVMGFLVGQVMKETKGQANPKIVNEILRNNIQ